jgi:hypothetical protein
MTVLSEHQSLSALLDKEYLARTLLELLAIPCPTGLTDAAVVYVCEQLSKLGIEHELTRRGTVRARLPGKRYAPQRAIVTHLDTIGAMVREIKPNGRLCLTPIGHWSSRFAEGARVSIFSDNKVFRGSTLPLYAAGHRYNEEVDRLPVTWDHVEVRVMSLSTVGKIPNAWGLVSATLLPLIPTLNFTRMAFWSHGIWTIRPEQRRC